MGDRDLRLTGIGGVMAGDVRRVSFTVVLQIRAQGSVSRAEIRKALDELEGVELISNPEQHAVIEEAHEAKGGSVVNKR